MIYKYILKINNFKYTPYSVTVINSITIHYIFKIFYLIISVWFVVRRLLRDATNTSIVTEHYRYSIFTFASLVACRYLDMQKIINNLLVRANRQDMPRGYAHLEEWHNLRNWKFTSRLKHRWSHHGAGYSWQGNRRYKSVYFSLRRRPFFRENAPRRSSSSPLTLGYSVCRYYLSIDNLGQENLM